MNIEHNELQFKYGTANRNTFIGRFMIKKVKQILPALSLLQMSNILK